MGYIAVIDYGVGNLMSVTNALQYIGRESKITDQASDLERADGIILPGVGAFPDAAEKLQQTGLVATLKEQAAKKPMLGICLGMQLLFDWSSEVRKTDGLGFVANLRVHGVDVKGAKMVVLGAGGAATAVTMQSAVDGASEIHIFNRKGYTFYPNAELTVKKITERIPGCKATVTDLFDTEALAEAVKNCDILVNATKVGMAPLDKETLIDKSLFRPDLIVCDTVYNPKETRMIVEAKEAGVRAAIGGIGMLLRQGVEGFRLYTGQEMPADEVMDKFFA